jgi:hypothetical protein
MKHIDEIMKSGRFSQVERSVDGFRAIIGMPGWSGSVVCSTGCGWEHVSVAPFKRRYVPGWDDMCKLKELFWNDDEAVIQIHPPKEEYVNNLQNCLHLWRCTYKEMVLPPSILVGVREGQSPFEIEQEIRAAYELAGEDWRRF